MTPRWTSEFIGKTLQINLNKATFSMLSTDSRTLPSGALFIALKGETFDGHQYIPQAIQKGATGILYNKKFPLDPQLKTSSSMMIAVDDPLESFRLLAKAWRALFKIPVIGVGGSVGKTTTKELLAAILSSKYPSLLKTNKSENGFVGIPMTLTQLQPQHEAAIIEIGIDQKGAMKDHVQIVQPTHSVLTAIGPEHLEKLKDLPTVAQEEAILLTETAQQGGAVAVNLDDPWIEPFSKKILSSQRAEFSISKTPPSEIRLVGEVSGQNLRLQGLGLPVGCELPLPFPGIAHARNLLAAVTVARQLGLNFDQIKKGLATFEGLEGRLQRVTLSHLSMIFLCDYYNANPSSVRTALEALWLTHSQNPPSRTFACLADMLELGNDEIKFHEELSKDLESHQTDFVYLLGPRMKALWKVLDSSKTFKGKVRHFQNHEDLGNALLPELRKGDVVLIKGSRSMKMEKLWHFIRDQLNSRPHE